MNSLNMAFMRDTEAFMRRHPLEVGGELEGSIGGKEKIPLPAGLYDFDLQDIEGTGTIRLMHFPAVGGRREGVMTHRIRGYWLPWVTESTASITLGDHARYFFTSSLSGCRMQIVPGENPTVLHIAGNQGGHEGKGIGGTQWRDRQAQAVLGPLYGHSRRFSSTHHYDRSQVAFVVGYRSFRFRGWRFLAQGSRQNLQIGRNLVSELSTHFVGSVVEI